MTRNGKRSTWLVLGALVAGLLLGALSNRAAAVREPLITVAATVGAYTSTWAAQASARRPT